MTGIFGAYKASTGHYYNEVNDPQAPRSPLTVAKNQLRNMLRALHTNLTEGSEAGGRLNCFGGTNRENACQLAAA
jgi:hypothetical protein